MSKETGVTVKKNENFAEWYTQVVTKAELADYSAVKGSMVLMPYGYEIWERIREFLDSRLKAMGHRNAYFPALIPESFLRKEAEHFAGFIPEVYWVTQSGDNALGERLAIRPTSETIIYDSYAKWLRSWRDLPILLNVWNSVFRAEITATKPFIRTTEFLWQEGHTVHETEEDADKEVRIILELYRELAEQILAMPVLLGTKSEREKFVGALYTTTIEAMMPDGKALQMGTSHNLGQNFSKAFEMRFIGRDEKMHLAWNTSWGVSWRLIGAVIMIHGDDKGLRLPPRISPIQAVIVPIFYKQADKEQILQTARDLLGQLTGANIRAVVDDREQYTPGWKFNEWELKGIPLRIELGPRDLESKSVTLVSRGEGKKTVVPQMELAQTIGATLESIQARMFADAKRDFEAWIHETGNLSGLQDIIESKGGLVRAGWCGSVDCEDKVKQKTGATIRAMPFDTQKPECPCVCCGEKATVIAYFARAY